MKKETTLNTNKPLVFWQSVPSIHQLPLIGELARNSGRQVFLITDSPIPTTRSNQGWNVHIPPEVHWNHRDRQEPPTSTFRETPWVSGDYVGVGGLHVPTAAIHVVSGYLGTSNWNTSKAKILTADEAELYIQIEGISSLGGRVKEVARLAKHYLGYLSLRKHITGILAISKRAGKQAVLFGVPSTKIYPMIYAVTQTHRHHVQEYPISGTMLFVGTRSFRKNTKSLVTATSGLCRLIMVGPCAPNWNDGAEQAPHVELAATVQNEDLVSYFNVAHALVLPSRFDGWGAVVNEALINGLPVICTNKCGAHELLEHGLPHRGMVINSCDPDTLRSAITKILKTDFDRNAISSWAEATISPRAIATYLTQVFNPETPRPIPPWLQVRK